MKEIERKRKFLLILAILAASVTYQTGLTPPGGFWTQSSNGHHIGNPLFRDEFPKQYNTFFYLNSTSFVASLAIIMYLVGNKMTKELMESYALNICIIVDIFSLLGAYAAGSTVKPRSSIYVLALVAAVFVCILLQVLIFIIMKRNSEGSRGMMSGMYRWIKNYQSTALDNADDSLQTKDKRQYLLRKKLIFLGTLAATCTYQAGLNPPGGIWLADSTTHMAGDPVIRENSLHRWYAFFYCNATAFIASIVVIAVLVSIKGQGDNFYLRASKTAIILDLLGILGAYAAGSNRNYDETAFVIALCIFAVAYLAMTVWLSIDEKQEGTGAQSDQQQVEEVPRA